MDAKGPSHRETVEEQFEVWFWSQSNQRAIQRAALKLQSSFRGYVARMDFSKRKKEHRAHVLKMKRKAQNDRMNRLSTYKKQSDVAIEMVIDPRKPTFFNPHIGENNSHGKRPSGTNVHTRLKLNGKNEGAAIVERGRKGRSAHPTGGRNRHHDSASDQDHKSHAASKVGEPNTPSSVADHGGESVSSQGHITEVERQNYDDHCRLQKSSPKNQGKGAPWQQSLQESLQG